MSPNTTGLTVLVTMRELRATSSTGKERSKVGSNADGRTQAPDTRAEDGRFDT